MSDHATDDGNVHPHISPVVFYWGLLAVLMLLTLLTYGLSFVNLGSLNLAVAVIIATAKATLVVLYFMHLRWDTPFNALVFLSSLVFLGIFLVYTINDTGSRGMVDHDFSADERGRFSYSAGEWAPAFGEGIGKPVTASGHHGADDHEANGQGDHDEGEPHGDADAIGGHHEEAADDSAEHAEHPAATDSDEGEAGSHVDVEGGVMGGEAPAAEDGLEPAPAVTPVPAPAPEIRRPAAARVAPRPAPRQPAPMGPASMEQEAPTMATPEPNVVPTPAAEAAPSVDPTPAAPSMVAPTMADAPAPAAAAPVSE